MSPVGKHEFQPNLTENEECVSYFYSKGDKDVSSPKERTPLLRVNKVYICPIIFTVRL